jgi:hypothetical protein
VTDDIPYPTTSACDTLLHLTRFICLYGTCSFLFPIPFIQRTAAVALTSKGDHTPRGPWTCMQTLLGSKSLGPTRLRGRADNRFCLQVLSSLVFEPLSPSWHSSYLPGWTSRNFCIPSVHQFDLPLTPSRHGSSAGT